MRYVIAGGGMAGVTAAKEMRKLDPQGSIAIYAAEAYPFYYRPRLWEFIAGRISPEETYYRPEAWYAEQDLQLHLQNPITGLDVENHRVTTANGEIISYDRFLIASGGRSFVPPVTGADLPGVFALRTLADAKQIVSYADTVKSAVLIGGGLLGLETAKALNDRGLQVSVVEVMERLLPRQLDEPGAAVLESYLRGLGMDVFLAARTDKIKSTADGLKVVLADGRDLETGMVVFSAGIRSNIEPWQTAGIQAERGLLVDRYLMTSAEDVYAAGDVAQYDGVVYGIIPAANEQGRVAGANLVSPGSEVYAGTVPATKLKIVEMEFKAYGDSTLEGEGVRIQRRVDESGGLYERLAIRDGKIAGAIMLGESRKALAIKKLIEEEVLVAEYEDRLLDDDFDLKALASA